ncbi:MAG: DUF2802 domain-containing protein [Gammaproteobacteria bacterium]|nr:DUF2802 domain-containing protein [Gammaproteobacteria bacterium]MBU1553214.1 DUF2802 domain-containing protein [Gammaproteobacteria bacterium]MBU2069619.1 DUF2802 domain-containing protein [Gammaproteobacteria bacterium]MBU2184484.1 DUF2802 domain-containing protein [Gammaproteobacteria bacterium]MBU2205166.1 DUF2802 domain-containing protein [Gammaproteobacteria bacterium]
MTLWLTVLIQAGLLALSTVVLWWWFKRHQSQDNQYTELERRLDYTSRQWQQSQLEVEELRAGIIGVGQRVLQLETALQQFSSQTEQQLSSLTEQQQAIALTDPESKIYSRAMKMVQLGADLEEIMRECELPRAEAELLYNLHQAKQ